MICRASILNMKKNAADKMKAIIENSDKGDNVINFPA